jgi:type IV pilus assembly protein PilM
MPLNLKLPFGTRPGADVVGLDIQPGFIAAAKVQVNGSIVAQRAVAAALPADVVREGEVVDERALSDALRELFAGSGLGKRVRLGVANQRTVMRTLQLPPMSDRKELAAAVNFQAQDQVPMPLANAVLDFHSLGVVDTHEGQRERVVLVAAQRDMIERLLRAVRDAGLQPEGVDLSAFALIRSLHRAGQEQTKRVLYLNVDGLTNLAIADGPICNFTRVVGGGIEAMASELAERRGIPVSQAREQIAAFDLGRAERELEPLSALEPEAALEPETGIESEAELELELEEESPPAPDDEQPAVSAEQHAAQEAGASFSELVAHETAAESLELEVDDEDVRGVIENAIREIAGDVRNSLDFHRSQDQGGEVSHVVLSGAALDLPGFVESLQMALDVEVRAQSVELLDEHTATHVSPHRLAVAAGLAAAEAPR